MTRSERKANAQHVRAERKLRWLERLKVLLVEVQPSKLAIEKLAGEVVEEMRKNPQQAGDIKLSWIDFWTTVKRTYRELPVESDPAERLNTLVNG